MDMVAHLQLEVEALKFVQLGPSTLAMKTLPVQSKPVAFTSTKVPKFSGVTSWDQYRQVFDAIVRSNGWDDATVVLQLLSHVEGDALNVALLVPEVKRATRAGLVGALTEHYGSPGRLADYGRQFERTTRQEGEDPSIFEIALETLAVKAFGDMGLNVRLRLIWDRFVAGHENCALRWHLDSVPPETPIRDIVDRCRVWESHADTGVRRIVKPAPERLYRYTPWTNRCACWLTRWCWLLDPLADPGDLEVLLRRLLPTAPVPTPPPRPIPTDIENLLERLLSEVPAPTPPLRLRLRDW